METASVSSVLISVACILVVTGLIKVVNWVWLKPKRLERLLKQQGLTGTSYRLLFGDVKEFFSMRTQALKKPMTAFSHEYFSRIEPFRHHLATKFGTENFMWFGPIPMLCISKPELIKEAWTKIDDFQKAKVNHFFDKLFPGVVSYEGEKWAKHRKLINPAFHMEKLKLMLPAIHESCAEIMSIWERLVDETGSVELDVWPDLTKLSADVISRAAFGSNYGEGQKIFELLKEQTELTLLILQSVNFPGRRHIPTARNKRFKEIEDQIHTSLRAIINKRKEAIGSGEPAKADLLGILLDSNSKEIQEAVGNSHKNQRVGMSLEELIDECKLFYLAGQETTSTLLVWTVILLSKHQDWQKRAREEVMHTFGDNVPDFEGLGHLKTVTMILHEALRLYPPVMQMTRSVPKDTKLGALSVPSGALITVLVYNVHRNQEIWGNDAHEFKPERFVEGVSKATKGNNAFFPFGWGPRICLGEKFAMTEAKMALALILQRFCFELSPSYVHAPSTVMFLQPQHGAQIILHKL